jgi:hypothetical protein
MIVANTHRTIGGLIAIKGATVSQRMIDSLTRSRVLNSSDNVEISRDLDQGEQKKKRVPDMAVGIALIVIGLVGSMFVYRSASATVSVVGVSSELDRGHVIEAGDLKALYVSPESAQYFVKANQAGSLIGRTMTVAVVNGTPLSESMVSSSLPLGVDEALTAAAVPIGNIPANLAANDKVRLVLTPDATITSASPPLLFDEVVSVWAIEQSIEMSNAAIVTFRGPLRLSLAIASAGNVRISLVNEE